MGNCSSSGGGAATRPEQPRSSAFKDRGLEREIRAMSIGDLKRELKARNIPLAGLVEKEDLIQALLKARRREKASNSKGNRSRTSRDRAPTSPATSASSGSTRRSSSPKKAGAAPASPRRIPPSPRKAGGSPVRPQRAPPSPKKASAIPRNTQGKVRKSASQPNIRTAAPQDRIDPKKWKRQEVRFNGQAAYASIGKQETVTGSIDRGLKLMQKHPNKYAAMTYQANMLDWPAKNQQYTLIHREGTMGYQPKGVTPSGTFAVVTMKYERCTPFPNNELPKKFRDKYTDAMSYEGRRLHSARNKPILPGRGMGCGDAPNLKIIGDVDPSDIHQGTVGDCWLLSAISALAEFDGAVKRLFRKTPNLDRMPLDGPNTYIISLYDLSTWKEVDVVIDERLCVQANGSGDLLGARPSEDGELWVCYLEKALAAHCGGWDKIKGGQCTHGWSLMTGCRQDRKSVV